MSMANISVILLKHPRNNGACRVPENTCGKRLAEWRADLTRFDAGGRRPAARCNILLGRLRSVLSSGVTQLANPMLGLTQRRTMQSSTSTCLSFAQLSY